MLFQSAQPGLPDAGVTSNPADGAKGAAKDALHKE